MKAITQINEFKEGANIRGFFLCVEKHLRNTRSGDLYLDLVLRDRTGQITAKLWKEVSKYHDKFSAGDAVVIAGQVDVYLDKLQLNIKKINVASVQSYGRYGYDPALIVPSAKSDAKQMWKELTSYIKKINNKYLKMLVTSVYKEYKSKLLTHPASIVMHHNYRSGLLEHTLSMVQLGILLAKHYKVDIDLLMTGILLHDIGKVQEITSELEASYSDEGNLIGHIVLGRDIAIKAANKINDFPPGLLQKVEHLILSHRGQYDWQSPKKPKFKEALLLHLINNLDAKMNLMQKAIDEDIEEGKWTSQRNYFRIPILKNVLANEDNGSK
jgi:3'-5' exoribonuclease